ncbi:hypothetical protein L2E82_30273 [Cichorium intybus]|uniref:Uncharacterized protein n=1 Tax=Cichorium intybus TaxID=13427 RepID=A0ACB9D020_CICIN|nr:hypothetical protein L2E82_30273 [Cichorium intybus]
MLMLKQPPKFSLFLHLRTLVSSDQFFLRHILLLLTSWRRLSDPTLLRLFDWNPRAGEPIRLCEWSGKDIRFVGRALPVHSSDTISNHSGPASCRSILLQHIRPVVHLQTKSGYTHFYSGGGTGGYPSINSAGSSTTSSAVNVVPTGNICRSRRLSMDLEELKMVRNEPTKGKLHRGIEAVKKYEEAIKLDSRYRRAHYRFELAWRKWEKVGEVGEHSLLSGGIVLVVVQRDLELNMRWHRPEGSDEGSTI